MKIDMGDDDIPITQKLQGAYDLAMEGYNGSLRPYDYLIEAKNEIERLQKRLEELELKGKADDSKTERPNQSGSL